MARRLLTASFGFMLAISGSLSACKKRNFNVNSAASSGELGTPSQVVIQCLAPQGNGGNWASTLGWVSEQWLQRAEAVAESEVRSGFAKDSSWLYLACASGGSSGSGVTAVVMSVLQNEALFPDSGGTAKERRRAGFYTPSEVARLARAIRFVAIGADMNFFASVEFFGLVVGQSLLAEDAGLKRQLGEWKRKLDGTTKLNAAVCSNRYKVAGNEQGVDWWKGQPAEPCEAVANFAKSAWLAKFIPYDMIMEPVGADSRTKPLGSSTSWAATYGMEVFSDLPVLPNVTPNNLTGLEAFRSKTTNYKALRRLGKIQSQVINDRLEELFKQSPVMPKKYKSFNLAQSALHMVEGIQNMQPGEAHPVALNVLGRKPTTGFFTITTAAVAEPSRFTGSNASRVPTYPEIRYVVFGNEETMRIIGNSPLLKSHLESCAKQGPTHPTCFAKRFVLGAVSQTHYMLQPSVREPDLMEELVAPAWGAGRTGAEHMGVEKMRDLALASSDFVDLTQGNAGANVVFGVTGGWPDRRITAWLQAYLVDGLLHGSSAGSRSGFIGQVVEKAPVTVFKSMFGKPDSEPNESSQSFESLRSSVVVPEMRSKSESEDKFDTKAVRSFFSKMDGAAVESSQAAQHVSDYIDFQNAYYAVLGPKSLAEVWKLGVVHDEVSVNWDLFKLPAMLNLNAISSPNRSRHLVHLSANAVREGAPGKAHLEKNAGQICQVVSGGKLGRTACSRSILSSPDVKMGITPYMDVITAVKAKSALVFNAGDPRLSDEPTPEAFEEVQAAEN